MATESIGKTVYMDDDFADRFIAAQERLDKNPPPPPYEQDQVVGFRRIVEVN